MNLRRRLLASVNHWLYYGLCVGSVTGGAAGVVTGGTIGYGGFTYQKLVADFFEDIWESTVLNCIKHMNVSGKMSSFQMNFSWRCRRHVPA